MTARRARGKPPRTHATNESGGEESSRSRPRASDDDANDGPASSKRERPQANQQEQQSKSSDEPEVDADEEEEEDLVQDCRISYSWTAILVHAWILYYLWSSLLFLDDITIRTFGHYVWWVLASTLTVLSFARWFPDLEIALYLHAVIPLNALLWLNFWLTFTSFSTPNTIVYLSDDSVPFAHMGTFATSVYPILFFYMFVAVRWNLLCIILRDFGFATAESLPTEAAFNVTCVASTFLFVIIWDWFVRPMCPAIDATDAAALPNTLLLTIPVYIHAHLFLFGVMAGGFGFQGPIHWRSVLDTGIGVWKLPDKEPILYMIW